MFGRKKRLDEATKAFKKKVVVNKNNSGEGFEDINMSNASLRDSLSSFNLFNKSLEFQHTSEITKIYNYRQMMKAVEISDVVEDACIEGTQTNSDNNVLNLKFIDKDLIKNENKVKTINEEFNDLFYNRLKMNKNLWNIFYNYMVDGRVYFERITSGKKGITKIKILPSESMDFKLDQNGNIEFFVQYLNKKGKLPNSIEEGEKDKDIVVFYPDQISYINFGIFGHNKKSVFGYLEKCKLPYNQLKLLETSVIIYRIIRAPERFVFRIDTGNMPKEKALRYVEGLKRKFSQSKTYNTSTGNVDQQPDVMCIRKNTEIPLLDGRYLTLENIINEFNDGKENWVYSINQKTLNVEPGKIINAKITRKDEKLIRIHFDNDTYIDTTYDHKFICRDGSECMAENLKVDDSLISLYKKNEVCNHKITKIEYLDERDDTGCITVEGNHNFAVSQNSKTSVFIKNSILENFWLPQSADGRGSQIDTIGGNFAAFSELDDIYYFQKKLYRSLKYPMSRIIKQQEGQDGDILFGNGRMGEITRDEIKWAKFLERQQNRICFDLTDLFLLHLEFKGIKAEYELTSDSFSIKMTPPNHYTDDIEQVMLTTQMENYQNLANNPEMPKTFLMTRYLKFTEEDLQEIKQGHAKDKEIIPAEEGY